MPREYRHLRSWKEKAQPLAASYTEFNDFLEKSVSDTKEISDIFYSFNRKDFVENTDAITQTADTVVSVASKARESETLKSLKDKTEEYKKHKDQLSSQANEIKSLQTKRETLQRTLKNYEKSGFAKPHEADSFLKNMQKEMNILNSNIQTKMTGLDRTKKQLLETQDELDKEFDDYSKSEKTLKEHFLKNTYEAKQNLLAQRDNIPYVKDNFSKYKNNISSDDLRLSTEDLVNTLDSNFKNLNIEHFENVEEDLNHYVEESFTEINGFKDEYNQLKNEAVKIHREVNSIENVEIKIAEENLSQAIEDLKSQPLMMQPTVSEKKEETYRDYSSLDGNIHSEIQHESKPFAEKRSYADVLNPKEKPRYERKAVSLPKDDMEMLEESKQSEKIGVKHSQSASAGRSSLFENKPTPHSHSEDKPEKSAGEVIRRSLNPRK